MQQSEFNLVYKWRHKHLHAVNGEKTSDVVCLVLVLAVVQQTFVYTAEDGIQQTGCWLLACVRGFTT